jgi:serine/threonine protein kinase
MAPEIMEEVGYSKEVDIWSSGVVLYVLLSGNLPYKEGKDFHERLRSIKKSNPNFKGGEWSQVSNSCKDLIKGMLNKDVKKRLTTKEILGKIHVSICKTCL